MMQILERAGIPLLTDGVRSADLDNPRGYHEFEPVKRLGRARRKRGAAALEHQPLDPDMAGAQQLGEKLVGCHSSLAPYWCE